MKKLTKVNAAPPVCRSGAGLASSTAGRMRASCVRGDRTNASWIEFVDHVVFGARPVVGLAVELMAGVKVGRVPLRAVLLTAMLVI